MAFATGKAAALETLRPAFAAAPLTDIVKWLGLLALRVQPSAGAETEGAAQAKIADYAHELSPFPADAARAAILLEAWGWWPPLVELTRAAEMVASGRRAAWGRLQRMNPPPLLLKGRRRTPEEIAAARAEADKLVQRFVAGARMRDAAARAEAAKPPAEREDPETLKNARRLMVLRQRRMRQPLTDTEAAELFALEAMERKELEG